jgi:iron(III) transport system permease protein
MNVHTSARLRRLLLWSPFLLLTCGPVLFVVVRSFFPNHGPFSLDAYAWILGSKPGAAERRVTLGHSVEMALCVVAATLAVGVPYGLLVARTDLRLRRLYEALVVVPLLLPPYLAGIAWVQVATLHGLSAIVFVLGSSLFPIVALLSARAFSEVGRDLEDAARLQLGERRAFLHVTLPLARGGIVAAALLVFVFAVSDFVVPDFFTFAGKGETSFTVFATEVYNSFARLFDPVSATATAVPLVLVSAVTLLLLARAQRRRSLASILGSHAPPRPYALGRAAPLAHLFLFATLGVTAGVPLGILGRMATREPGPPPSAPIATALKPGQPPPPPSTVDLNIYRDKAPVRTALVRYAPDVVHSLRNASVAVLLLLAAAFLPARAMSRDRRGSAVERALVLLPLAFPSLLIGMSVEQLAIAADLPDRAYRGWGLVSLTLASRFLPVGVLGLAATWSRVAPEVEESAQLAPIGAGRRWGRVTLPLLMPGLAAAAIVTLGLCMREFDAIVLLPGAVDMLTSRIYSLVHYAQDAVVGALALMQVAAVFVPWAALRLLTSGRGREGS